jgi:hypothetical protein
VDAFLTGLVKVDFKKGTAKVIIQAFDKSSKDLRKIEEFNVNLDRTALTDMNLNYVVRRQVVGGTEQTVAYVKNGKRTKGVVLRRGDLQPDDVNEDPKGDPKPPPDVQNPDVSPATIDKLLKFQIFYDGQPREVDAENRVVPPQKDQKVYFSVQNISPNRIGLVVRVNGINTLRKEKDRQPEEYSMWVLEPGKEYSIAGFYPDNSAREDFKVFGQDEVNKTELGDEGKWGKIEVDVFTGKADVEQRRVSLRHVTRRAATLAEAKAQIKSATSARAIRRNFIAPGDRTSADIQSVPFEGGLSVSQTITYFNPKQ